MLNKLSMSTFILSILLCSAAAAETMKVNLVYIGDKGSSAYSGVLLGLKESNLQGQFLGQSYELSETDTAKLDELAAIKPQAVFTDVSGAELLKIASALPDTAIFNLADEDNALRARCVSNLLHVIPSKKMRDDAVNQWQQKNPESKPLATAWHQDFVKFAARDLNKRYSKNQGQPMDSAAWAGWAAVRIISEAVAREQTTAAAEILNFSKNKLEFDGQKGILMNFRKTGQLRQPLLISEQGKLLGEAPVRGVVETDDLDSLGNVECS